MKSILFLFFLFFGSLGFGQKGHYTHLGGDLIFCGGDSDTLILDKISWLYEADGLYYYIEFKPVCDYTNYPEYTCSTDIFILKEDEFLVYLNQYPILKYYARISQQRKK